MHAHIYRSARGRLALAGVAGSALLGGALLGTTGAVAAPASSVAPAASNANVFVDAVGMKVNGLAGPNRLKIELVGDSFHVTDDNPIAVSGGCTSLSVPGPRFGAQCEAPTFDDGRLKRFQATGGDGDDVVTNATPVSMQATGGLGNDTLIGGQTGDQLIDSLGGDVLRGRGGGDALRTSGSGDIVNSDSLIGGAGDDDLGAGPSPDRLLGGDGQDFFRAGLGADLIDGGPGLGDSVTYVENGRQDQRVVVILDDIANDGENAGFGGPSEGDNVLDSIETVFGGFGPDLMIGNSLPNTFVGNLGDDDLAGGRGADSLRGDNGDDELAGNQLLGFPVSDGATDLLNGGDDFDRCRVPVGGEDGVVSCEAVIEQ